MIDAHVHVWTDDCDRYPRVWPGTEFAPLHFPPEKLFRHSLPNGVARAVLVQMSFYGCDNSFMLDCLRAHPGVFGAIGVVDWSTPEVGAAMLALARHGVRGFRIHTESSAEEWLADPGMGSMWRCAAEEQLAVCPLVNPHALEALDRLCQRHPETPVVVDHLGRIGVDGVIRPEDRRQLCSLAKHPKVYVKVSAFYALGQRRAPYHDLLPFLQQVFDAFGPQRLLWGSDCPFQIQDGHTYSDSLALLAEGLPFLRSEDKSWMLGKTAEQLFF
ncbi:MAG: amidohydrolase family protein [Acidobacteria bacterium]|nr:amidohydrolase family protein [Acidobacteriota bacterium]